jgi:hypothetical protein
MLNLYTAFDVQMELRAFISQSRKLKKCSVEALSTRSGVPYGTIRKFESTGNISLGQFLMLYEVVGDLKKVHSLTKPESIEPSSIEEVLKNA